MVGGERGAEKGFLPPILAGDVSFGIGYTEPEAGTDLFSLKTTAIKDVDGYVINGRRYSPHPAWPLILLACSTYKPGCEAAARGHIIFLVDAKTPGITRQPMDMMCGYGTAQEFFDNVRVPKECLVGTENQGVLYMVTQMAHERISLVPHSTTVISRQIEAVHALFDSI